MRGIRRAAPESAVHARRSRQARADFRGDPSSALPRCWIPANGAFVDHYLDVPFDLSQVMFLTTANYLDPVPPALLDRMEVIELSGYTDHEKLEIAKRHLIPKGIRENGLDELHIAFADDAILKVVHEYTREAGLRNIERELTNLLRKTQAGGRGRRSAGQSGPRRNASCWVRAFEREKATQPTRRARPWVSRGRHRREVPRSRRTRCRQPRAHAHGQLGDV